VATISAIHSPAASGVATTPSSPAQPLQPAPAAPQAAANGALPAQPAAPTGPSGWASSFVSAINAAPGPHAQPSLHGFGDASFFSTSAAPPVDALADVQELPVSGVTLAQGQPLILQGLDPNRPIKRITVEMASGSAAVQVGQLPEPGPTGFDPPVYGGAVLTGAGQVKRVRVTYGDPASTGDSDFFAIPAAVQGIKPGGTMSIPVPAHRRGRAIDNINVSFWAPVRVWDPAGRGGAGEEKKPTYCTWYLDGTTLQRKFVDPNADNGNAPEIDNVHGANANAQAVLARVPTSGDHSIRIVAENQHIPPSEDAMTVQWVKVSYQPTSDAALSVDLRGAPLPNHEWKGHWIQSGGRYALEVDPTWKISRVDVQWSDKPDDVGYEAPGKWARGTLLLDGKVVGNIDEHVGSPEWQTFENTQGVRGGKLEIRASGSPLKILQVKVYREP
jgi:hypothetical protein